MSGEKRTWTVIAVTILILQIAGCAAPGAPKIRTSSDDGQGPLASGCQNLSTKSPTMDYDTRFYHSTWRSAWIEGTQTGYRKGLGIDDGVSDYKKEYIYALILQIYGLDGRNYPFPPFCMIYNAPKEQVQDAIEAVLPLMGNPVKDSDRDSGVFGVGLIDREHSAAKWRDQYIIRTGGDGNTTMVTVYRDLSISRLDEPYARAQSSGHNEAWLLQRIAKAISR